MSFLYPLFLLGALAAAVPVILHLLRRDVAPDVPFTAVRLLKKSPIERSKRRRLRDLLLLAARVTALLLLAAAFARPFAPTAASAMLPLRIVAVDRSFSMGAAGQFDRALEAARQAIGEAGFQERVAVIAFDERADVLATPGTPAEARRALDGLAVGYGATRYATLLAKAADVAGGGPARLVLISDLQRSGWEGERLARVPETLEIDLRGIESSRANVGVVDARRADAGIVATVLNAAPDPRSGTLVLKQEDKVVAQAPYTVAASATEQVTLSWRGSGAVEISIDDKDGFPGDDRRFFAAGGSADPVILVVASADSPGFFLERALAVTDQEEDDASLTADFLSPGQIAGGRTERISRYRAVALLSTRGLDQAAREAIATFVRAGGGLFVAAAPDVEAEVLGNIFGWTPDGFTPRREARPATLGISDVRHPVFRPFGALAANLGAVRFTETWRLSPDGWRVPAKFDDGSPAFLERREGEGRVVVFPSDVDRRWNDFPLHPSFVPFILETLRYVSSAAAGAPAYIVGRTPPGVSGEPGIHRVHSGRLVTVNVDPRESATETLTPDEFRAMLEPVANVPQDPALLEQQTEARQSLWQYGLLLMLMVLVAESFVGRA